MENLQNKQDTVLENSEPTFIENTPQAQPVKKVQHRSYRYIFGALVALVVVSGAGALFAMQSIPGDTLYTTKTSFLEPLVEKAQLSNKNKTFYQVTLMKHS